MSTRDDSPNNDDTLIDFVNSKEVDEVEEEKKPKIRIRMEDPKIDEIFDEDDGPYVVRVAGEILSGISVESERDTETEKSDRTDRSCRSLGYDDRSIESDVETEESTDLIDVTPEASVARIKNQTISSRDDDVDGMRRHRNIMGVQAGRKKSSLAVKSKKKTKYPHGYLKLVFGSMFSGKSTELRTDRNDWRSIKGIRILVVNYSHDNRYTDDNMVMTHNKEGLECISVENLAEITNGECYDEGGNTVLPDNYDLILIDEGQFYPDLRHNIIHWVDILCKTVYVYGLDGDFRRQKFGQMMDLIPLCDKIIKKKANCMICNNGTEALFSWKIENNNDEATTVEIGGSEKYVALCRKHYNRLNRPQVMITGNLYSKK